MRLRPSHKLDEKGGIVIIAVWALLILSAVAIGFAYRMSIETKMVALREDNLRAVCLARAGIKKGIYEVSKDQSWDHDSRKEIWFDNPGVFKDQALEGGTFAVVALEAGVTPEERRYGVVDEESKINLNSAGEDILERVFRDYPWVVPAVLDWRDTDDVPRPGGAENAYYMSLPSPYACRNGPFRIVEELQMVNGMTPEILKEVYGLITTHGLGSVNFNTCGERVLECLGLPEHVIDAVILCRGGPDSIEGTEDDMIFKTVEDIRTGLEGYLELTEDEIGRIDELVRKGMLSVKSSCFRIHSVGATASGDARKEITAVVERQREGLPQVVFWYEG
jgi:type II secretory pathway component PulK